MPLHQKIIAAALLSCIWLSSALALPPALTSPPSWSDTVRAACQRAQTIAKVRVVQSTLVATPEVWPGGGSIETAEVEPVTIYKGRLADVPRSFQTRFTGAVCDRPPKFEQGTEPVVFLSVQGELVLIARTFPPESYTEALQLLEAYTAKP